MEIRFPKVTVSEFIRPLKTSNFIEERIKLMLEDPNVLNIYFHNGVLGYSDTKYNDFNLEDWKLTLVDTIELIQNFVDLLEMNEQKIMIILKDARIDFSNIEDCSIADHQSRLNASDMEFTIYKYTDKNPYFNTHPDDLPF